jgi:polyisoprenoid-binding protein YceI
MNAQKFEVNTSKSGIKWLGTKIGGQHKGTIQLKSGTLELNKGQIVSGKFVVDMTSITNTDLKNKTYKQKLVSHLKSDDFFAVEKFPASEFVIKKSTNFNHGKATISGDITIKGKTENLTFEVDYDGKAYRTTIDIDRSKFDVRYGSTSFFDNLGDKAIDDIFTLTIEIVIN